VQTPYAHQLEGIQLLRDNPRYALWWDCGVGKSLPVIRVVDERLEEQVDLCIVLAPKVALHNWSAELLQNAENIDNLFILDGKPAERRDELDEIATLGGAVVVLNYDLLRYHKEQLQQLVEDRRVMMVLDESHYVKGSRAQRTKIAIKLADECDYVVLLTGTPIGNSIEDVWSQYRVLDGGKTFGTSFFKFRHSYMVQVPHVPGMWVASKGADAQVKKKMWSLASHKSKEECLDLPDYREQQWVVAPPDGMVKFYKEFALSLIAQYASEGGLSRLRAANAAVAAIKLQQITSGFFISDTDQITELKWQPKLEAVKEICEETCPHEKVVIWSRFRRDIAMLLDGLKDFNPLSIESKHSSEQRMETMNTFNDDNDHRVLVSNPASGGVAINLQSASTAVYYSNDYSHIHRVQSRDRLHRIGQERMVTYIDLVVPGTIDVAVLKALFGKQSLVDYLQEVGIASTVMPEEVKYNVGSKVGRGPDSGKRTVGKARRLIPRDDRRGEGSQGSVEETVKGEGGAVGGDTPGVVRAWW